MSAGNEARSAPDETSAASDDADVVEVEYVEEEAAEENEKLRAVEKIGEAGESVVVVDSAEVQPQTHEEPTGVLATPGGTSRHPKIIEHVVQSRQQPSESERAVSGASETVEDLNQPTDGEQRGAPQGVVESVDHASNQSPAGVDLDSVGAASKGLEPQPTSSERKIGVDGVQMPGTPIPPGPQGDKSTQPENEEAPELHVELPSQNLRDQGSNNDPSALDEFKTSTSGDALEDGHGYESRPTDTNEDDGMVLQGIQDLNESVDRGTENPKRKASDHVNGEEKLRDEVNLLGNVTQTRDSIDSPKREASEGGETVVEGEHGRRDNTTDRTPATKGNSRRVELRRQSGDALYDQELASSPAGQSAEEGEKVEQYDLMNTVEEDHQSLPPTTETPPSGHRNAVDQETTENDEKMKATTTRPDIGENPAEHESKKLTESTEDADRKNEKKTTDLTSNALQKFAFATMQGKKHPRSDQASTDHNIPRIADNTANTSSTGVISQVEPQPAQTQLFAKAQIGQTVLNTSESKDCDSKKPNKSPNEIEAKQLEPPAAASTSAMEVDEQNGDVQMEELEIEKERSEKASPVEMVANTVVPLHGIVPAQIGELQPMEQKNPKDDDPLEISQKPKVEELTTSKQDQEGKDSKPLPIFGGAAAPKFGRAAQQIGNSNPLAPSMMFGLPTANVPPTATFGLSQPVSFSTAPPFPLPGLPFASRTYSSEIENPSKPSPSKTSPPKPADSSAGEPAADPKSNLHATAKLPDESASGPEPAGGSPKNLVLNEAARGSEKLPVVSKAPMEKAIPTKTAVVLEKAKGSPQILQTKITREQKPEPSPSLTTEDLVGMSLNLLYQSKSRVTLLHPKGKPVHADENSASQKWYSFAMFSCSFDAHQLRVILQFFPDESNLSPNPDAVVGISNATILKTPPRSPKSIMIMGAHSDEFSPRFVMQFKDVPGLEEFLSHLNSNQSSAGQNSEAAPKSERAQKPPKSIRDRLREKLRSKEEKPAEKLVPLTLTKNSQKLNPEAPEFVPKAEVLSQTQEPEPPTVDSRVPEVVMKQSVSPQSAAVESPPDKSVAANAPQADVVMVDVAPQEKAAERSSPKVQKNDSEDAKSTHHDEALKQEIQNLKRSVAEVLIERDRALEEISSWKDRANETSRLLDSAKRSHEKEQNSERAKNREELEKQLEDTSLLIGRLQSRLAEHYKRSASLSSDWPEKNEFRPYSLEDFRRRLKTFSPITWAGKEKEIDAVECARRGWINTAVDVLKGDGNETVLFDAAAKDRKSEVQRVRAMICGKGRQPGSGWVATPCPANFRDMPNVDSGDARLSIETTVQQLAAINPNLTLHPSSLSRMEDAKAVLSAEGIGEDSNQMTYYLVAMSGWGLEPRESGQTAWDVSPSSSRESTFMCCKFCHAEILLADLESEDGFQVFEEHRVFCPIDVADGWKSLLAAYRKEPQQGTKRAAPESSQDDISEMPPSSIPRLNAK